MTYKNTIILGSAIALTMGFGGVVRAAQDEEVKEKLLLDPMTRAEMQCAKLKADAALGTDDEKKAAERKCEQAIEWAKEMIKKDAEKKPKPDPDPSE